MRRSRPSAVLRKAQVYDVSKFFRPSVTVDVVIFTIQEKELRVLLIRRGQWPFKNRWALRAASCSSTRTSRPRRNASCSKETGVQGRVPGAAAHLRPSRPGPPPPGCHRGLLRPGAGRQAQAQGPGDAGDVRWWSIYCLPELAFDHDQILDNALTRLRAKIMATNVAFQLCPANSP